MVELRFRADRDRVPCGYTIFQAVSGRLLDKLGTRRGLSLAVLWYSVVAMATSAATGLKSFAAFRFLLGAGEAANWPGATKAVSEWFPKSERGMAVAIFDSGSAVGGAIAPVLVIWLYRTLEAGGRRSSSPACWESVWLIRVAARSIPRTPKSGGASPEAEPDGRPIPGVRCCGGARPGASCSARRSPIPVWFFITDWFAIYLVSKGFKLENTLLGFWVPFLAADLGQFRRRRTLQLLDQARLAGIEGPKDGGAAGRNRHDAAGPNDLRIELRGHHRALCDLDVFLCRLVHHGPDVPGGPVPDRTVATVSGMSGAAAGVGTIISTLVIGKVSDRYSFEPVLIGASLLPVIATILVFVLIRPARQ